MPSTSGWDIDWDSCGRKTLLDIYRLLKDSPHAPLSEQAKNKLVTCLKQAGTTDQKIIDILTRGVGRKKERAEIAQEWCTALGLTAREFMLQVTGAKISRKS